ncbi:Dihydrolipoamide dehydrogenase [Sterolibacterium denitrificans]|uniref:Dihydrolipoamide dehydrogenase n=1 Tax=Sterolibacterium denitrificans TaxID=157592 RepID=A0A7Z7MUH2_9PROT|nr:dihydrolipoyl dehydrogenase [Sterolibacterium denitrificans]SMB22515.1 Dihydrolipoamide dehydrogenase [Sterolibacterium denitrificans]
MVRKTRLVIIGAGSAGLTALKEAQRTTQNLLLINDGPYGTTCARVGCMPSKALLGPAHAYGRRHFLEQAGIRGTSQLNVDLPALLRHVRQLRDRFTAGSIELAHALGERNLQGRPRFLDAHALELNGERIEFEAAIIATGSRPVVPVPWEQLGRRVLTSDDFFEQENLGRRVAVVGLGAIGVELGQGLAQLGLEVVGLTRAQTVAGLHDQDISDALVAALRQDMQVLTGVDVGLQPAGEQGILVQAGEQSFEVNWVLASLGRRPNLEDLGLENLGVALDAYGMPAFHPQTLKLGDLPIYIAGDVNGMRPLLHEAADEGRIAAYHALHADSACLGRRVPLGIVFTEPNAAQVGAHPDELQGTETVSGEVDFARQGRALMEGRNVGRLRVYARSSDGRLLGAQIVAPDGEHLAHLLAWAIQQRLTVDEVLQLPVYHPVVEEGLRSALQAARRALGLRRRLPDLPLCNEPAAWALGGE